MHDILRMDGAGDEDWLAAVHVTVEDAEVGKFGLLRRVVLNGEAVRRHRHALIE